VESKASGSWQVMEKLFAMRELREDGREAGGERMSMKSQFCPRRLDYWRSVAPRFVMSREKRLSVQAGQ
jgi:hypothetical protein